MDLEQHGSGDLTDAEFDNMLAEQAAKSRESEGTPAPPAATPSPNPASDSGAAIRAGLLGGDGVPSSGNVREGLTIEEPREPQPPLGAMTPELEAIVKSGQAALDAEAEEMRLGREAREELRIRDFVEGVLPSVASRAQLAGALAELKREISEDHYDRLIVQIASDISGVDPEDEDTEFLDGFSEELLALGAEVEQAEAQQRYDQAGETLRKVIPVAAAETAEAMRDEIQAWRHEKGLQPAEAKARLEVIEQASVDFFGVPLSEIHDPKAFGAALRAADATLTESTSAERTRAFHEQLLGAPSTHVGDGIEVFGPLGWQQVNAVNLDAELGPPLTDAERTVARSSSKRTTGEAIRNAVAATDPASVKDGFEDESGNPVSIDDAFGITERLKAEMKAREPQIW